MTTIVTSLGQAEALEVIESLRKGIPPKRYTSHYTAGTEDFLKKVRSFHLESASTRGKLRFVSGSWGAGKTHFLRLLREEAFDAKYLVSNRDSLTALRDLVFREGIFGGPSCGAVLVAAAREARRLRSGTIVALLPDGGWKYLSAGTYTTDFDEMGDALEGGVNWW